LIFRPTWPRGAGLEPRGLAFGGAQKNIGPAGLTIVIVRDDLLGRALDICPSAFNYKTVADNQSMFNTPPTWGIYMAGLTFQWLKRQREGDLTGVAAMEARNQAKAEFFYRYLDNSQLYVNKVDAAYRSRMNIRFSCAKKAATRLSWQAPRSAACCSSRATSRSAACAPACTTPCRWQVCKLWWHTCKTLSAPAPEAHPANQTFKIKSCQRLLHKDFRHKII
jgi:Phosphoserine aminotransferase